MLVRKMTVAKSDRRIRMEMLTDWLFLGTLRSNTRAAGCSLSSASYWMWCDKWKRLNPHETSVNDGSPHASKRLVNDAFDMLIGLLL